MCNEIENLEKKIQVISVIRISCGIIDEVKSFTFLNLDKAGEEEAVAKAEEYFIDSIKDCDGYDAEEDDNYIEEGHFQDSVGWKDYYLTWSV